jgi:hypothetical protein
LTQVRTNHFGEVVENRIGMAFFAAEVPHRWKVRVFGKCVEGRAGYVEMDNLEWGVPEHSGKRLQVEYPYAAAPPTRCGCVSTVYP